MRRIKARRMYQHPNGFISRWKFGANDTVPVATIDVSDEAALVEMATKAVIAVRLTSQEIETLDQFSMRAARAVLEALGVVRTKKGRK